MTAQEEQIKHLTEELRVRTVTLDSLMQELKAEKDNVNTIMKENSTFTTSLQEKDKCVEELKDEIIKIRQQMIEEKSAFDTQVQMIQQEYKNEVSQMEGKLSEQKETLVKLETNKHMSEKENLTLTTSLQEKEKCIEELKDEINKTRQQMIEEKSAFDTQIKIIEQESVNMKLEMESDMQHLIEQRTQDNVEKEGVLLALQKDKDNLMQTHTEDKCEFMKTIEQNKQYIETLQHKYENLNNQYAAEKLELENKLKYSQESCCKLMKEYDEVKESLNTKITDQALNLQEKENEMTAVKEEMEGMKAVNADLVNKYESDVKKLSFSLQTEQDNLTKMDEKCLILQQQSEESSQQYKNEVSQLEQKFTKQEEDLVQNMQINKQLFEKENSTLTRSLQEKEKCVQELKDEINKTRQQMTQEKVTFDTQMKIIKQDYKNEVSQMEEKLTKQEEVVVKLETNKHMSEKENLTLITSLQEKMNEITAMKEEMEGMKAVNADLVNKYESDIQRLSLSLQTEQDNLTKMNEKCLILQQQSEESSQQYKNEVSQLEEKLTKQEEALVENIQTNKQLFEKEQLTLTNTLQEKEKCVEELKDEIIKTRQQMIEEKEKLTKHEEDLIENIQTLKVSNEELNKQITEHKNNLTEMNEKYNKVKSLHNSIRMKCHNWKKNSLNRKKLLLRT